MPMSSRAARLRGPFVLGLGLGLATGGGAQGAPPAVPTSGADMLMAFETTATFQDTVEVDLLLQRLGPDGQPRWDAPRPLAHQAGARSTDAALCGDGQGGAFVIWSEAPVGVVTAALVTGEETVSRRFTRLLRIDGEGRPLWPAPLELADSTSLADKPVVLEDGVGGAWTAWRREGPEGTNRAYLQRFDGAGKAHATPQLADTTFDSVDSIRLLPDGAGGVLAILDADYLGVYAQRFSPTDGPLWSGEDLTLASPFGGHFGLDGSVAVADGQGGCFVACQEIVQGGPYEGASSLLVQHLSALGKPVWGVDGEPVRINSEMELCGNPTLVADGLGGVLLAYETGHGDFESGESWIEAARLDKQGHAVWPQGPVVALRNEWRTRRPVLLADGAGGAYLAASSDTCVWQGDGDIVLQHLGAKGTLEWGGAAGRILPGEAGLVEDSPRLFIHGDGIVVVYSSSKEALEAPDVLARQLDRQGRPVEGAGILAGTPLWDRNTAFLGLPPN